MGELGIGTLTLALAASIYSVIFYFIGSRKDNPVFIKSARNAVTASAGLLTISVAILLTAILSHNFELAYVANYTSRQMSFIYLVSALWAGNDGSLLFWAWLISICAVLIVYRKKGLGLDLVPYSSSVIMFVLSFFVILLISIANPFETSAIVPADGAGLNPMLENPGMVIHPSMLLAGYVTLTIPFSYAIAALFTGRLNNDWIKAVRKWTIISWLFLGVGNILGAWWAYVELGWGGYWAWDPVENSGLMPWLLTTAFLHSVMIQKRSGMMKIWNMALIIFAFILVIFGTFITRSGILSSVHTYSEKGIGSFFVVFLAILLISSLVLLFRRGNELKSESEIESPVSREGTFLLTNILFVLATVIVFIGTIFPAIAEAITGSAVTVGPSFFNQVNGPLFSVIILLIGVCTLIGWRSTIRIQYILKRLILPAILAAITALLLFLLWFKEVLALFAFFFSTIVLFTLLSNWIADINARHRSTGENYLRSFMSLFSRNRARYGAFVIHLGIILLAIGVVGSSLFDIEKTETLSIGDTLEINDYSMQYNGIEQSQSGYKSIVRANLSLSRAGSYIGELNPEKIYHEKYNQAVTEVDIRSTPIEDFYVALGRWNEDNSAVFQVSVHPLVAWIWIGGIVLGAGGIICFWPDKEKAEESAG